MASVELTNEQIINLLRQLTAEDKRQVLMALASDSQVRRTERRRLAAEQLRQQAVKRGLDWDTMTDEERESLVDDLVHEDRPCQP